MSALSEELAATGATNWVALPNGPRTTRLYGTWAGSAQLEVKGSADADADASPVGDAVTANGAWKIDVSQFDNVVYRWNFTRTSGTLKVAIG